MAAYTQQQAAIRGRHDRDYFHGSVLFTQASRLRYDEDQDFHKEYRTANLQSLWELTGIQTADIVAPSSPLPSTGIGNLRLDDRGTPAQVEQVGEDVPLMKAVLKQEQEKKRLEKKQRGRNGGNVNGRSTKRGPTFAGIMKKGITKMFGWRRR